ncbi:MAG: hypothetical protein WBG32_13700, partial [Nodosilinea sp.]
CHTSAATSSPSTITIAPFLPMALHCVTGPLLKRGAIALALMLWLFVKPLAIAQVSLQRSHQLPL